MRVIVNGTVIDVVGRLDMRVEVAAEGETIQPIHILFTGGRLKVRGDESQQGAAVLIDNDKDHGGGLDLVAGHHGCCVMITNRQRQHGSSLITMTANVQPGIAVTGGMT